MNERQNLPSEQALAQNIEHFLQEIVEGSDPMPNRGTYYAGRPITLPALVLWSSVLVAVLRGFTSQLAIWRLITWSGFWGYTPYQLSDQAVYNRLADGGSVAIRDLFYQVRDGLKARLEPYAQTDLAKFASGVYAIDDSVGELFEHSKIHKNSAVSRSKMTKFHSFWCRFFHYLSSPTESHMGGGK